MRILFEEHQYQAALVQDVLDNIYTLQDIDKNIRVGYVGYFFNPSPKVRDCVFILPKVLLSDMTVTNAEGRKETIEVLGHVPKYKDEKGEEHWVTPEMIIEPEGQERYLTREYRKFIYEFAVWVYRSLDVYRKQNPMSQAIYYKQMPQEGKGRKQKISTFLDIILSLIRFNNENQNYFMFTVHNMHSGQNKINWTRTISKSEVIIQDGSPIYLNPVNKKRQINFDEELLVIFFSILHYLNENYGFRTPVNLQYDLIKGKRFESYMNGVGRRRLKAIKYKYFSDKALELWNLCYAFFDSSHLLATNMHQQEYLLAKKYEHVFEAMVDELIGDRDIPRGLKDQDDGKRVDHMYVYDALTSNNEHDEQIYYIGDSKYYKKGHSLGKNSIYKQYTYARNVIQWNIDLFMKGQHANWESEADYDEDKAKYGRIRLRQDEKDPLTEGYNVIPNFFLSAFVDDKLAYVAEENIVPHRNEGMPSTYVTWQFEDRLFDRDTLVLSHYDVNFLYVLYLYSRNKSGEKRAWRTKVRDKFRKEIRDVLQDKYDFYALRSKGNHLMGEEFIKDHFKELQGKLYRPYGDENLYALALEKREGSDTSKSETYSLLNDIFLIEKVDLGFNPQERLQKRAEEFQSEHPYPVVEQELLPQYPLERYRENYIVVGSYHNEEHWKWITGNNDKGTLIYNVRLDPSRAGSETKTSIRTRKPRFAILYEEGHEQENNYHVFRIHDMAVMNEARMIKAKYLKAKGDYFIFRFDEEISLGNIDIKTLIESRKTQPGFVPYAPLYVKGEELMAFRK